MIGQRILHEAVSRGHPVTAILRDLTREPAPAPRVEYKPGDVLKAESVALAIKGSDVVVSAYGPGGGDSVQLITAAKALIEGATAVDPHMRLIVVNGESRGCARGTAR